MMELNKPKGAGGELVFKAKHIFKTRVTKKNSFVWILSQNFMNQTQSILNKSTLIQDPSLTSFIKPFRKPINT